MPGKMISMKIKHQVLTSLVLTSLQGNIGITSRSSLNIIARVAMQRGKILPSNRLCIRLR